MPTLQERAETWLWVLAWRFEGLPPHRFWSWLLRRLNRRYADRLNVTGPRR
jgi:hypothetical protein